MVGGGGERERGIVVGRGLTNRGGVFGFLYIRLFVLILYVTFVNFYAFLLFLFFVRVS